MSYHDPKFSRLDTELKFKDKMAYVEIPREILRQVQLYPGDQIAITVHRMTNAINIRHSEQQDKIEDDLDRRRLDD
jgi:hypothetical protein